MQIDCPHHHIYKHSWGGHHPAYVLRGRRLFEDEGCDDDFIIESDFDEDKDFFAHIFVYIFIKLMIGNFSIFLSFSSMN